MWSLYENNKILDPLIFSNGKSQEDIVNEVIESIRQGYKIIFIRGMCGTGKSAIALNLAANLGKTSIVVPIKSLQEQYSNDYSKKMQVKKGQENLKILSIVGRGNFKCRYLKENDLLDDTKSERNSTIFNFESQKVKLSDSCDNPYLPCKIEIKEKNLFRIKDYIKKNPSIKMTDFSSVTEVTRMSIAPICPYWSPILPEEFELKKFKEAKKIKYKGLENKHYIFYQRMLGCPYYEQYAAYNDADVIIFNSSKYLLETLMNRKPETELEIIDECDEFLDSFANQEQINLNRLMFSLTTLYTENPNAKNSLKTLIDITNNIRSDSKFKDKPNEIYPLNNTHVFELLDEIIENSDLIDVLDNEESSYLNHLEKVSQVFKDSFDETFFSIEKKENDFSIHLVTTNLSKKLNEVIDKNKIFIMMSGTIHSEIVLKNIFGLENFKIIEAEVHHQGNLIKKRYGYEVDCKYENLQSNKVSRKDYLEALSKSVLLAKRPTLVHVTGFSDLPSENERLLYDIKNLPTQSELISEQISDPFGKRINEFKHKKMNILFTTKCSRGVDFPGDICNSIIITRFPYPNISSIFWKILRKNRPLEYRSFYLDKSKRELLQKIYRGLRSKNDQVELLSPDVRVLDFEFN